MTSLHGHPRYKIVAAVDAEIDRACERIARAQYGVITRTQALEAGMTVAAIRNRLSRAWRQMHPQVYALPGAWDDWRQALLAACLWSEDGVASHLSAAALWRLPGARQGRPHITVRRCHLAPRSGIHVHHTDKLPESHLARVDGIPCTCIERTLLDLGAVWPESRVAVAVDDALRRGLTTLTGLDQCIREVARRGRRGVGKLRRVVREREGRHGIAESPLETRLFQLLRRSNLPMPQFGYEIRDSAGRFVARVDACYPAERLVLEVESWQHHSGRSAWAHDYRRRNLITGLGYDVMHLTSEDLWSYPDRTLRDISDRLRAAR